MNCNLCISKFSATVTQTVVPGAARRLLTRRLQRREEGKSGARREQTACLHGIAKFPTCPDLDVLHRGRRAPRIPTTVGRRRRPGALQPPLLRPSSPWTSEPTLHAVSRPGLFRTPHCRTSPAQETKQSQGANTPTWNSILFWQFGEICAQEPSVPLKVNRGPAAIYRSGLTDNRSHRAVRRPIWLS